MLALTSAECRHKRLQEMRQTAKRPQFGLITNIVRADFIPEVTSASKDVWVIVHLYKDKCTVFCLRCCSPN